MDEKRENIMVEEENLAVKNVIPQLPEYDIVRRDSIFSIILLIASLVTSAFGIWGGFRVGLTVSMILMLFSVTAYLLPSRAKIKVFPLLCMVMSVGVSLSFTFTTNSAVRFWSFVVIGLLDLVWFASLSGEQSEKGDLGIFENIFKPVIYGAIAEIPTAFKSLITGNGKGGKALAKVLIGIAFALPVLLIVVPLLISSDEAFSGMMKLIFSDLFSTAAKLALGVVIGVFVISYSLFLKKSEPLKSERKKMEIGIENIIMVSFLAVISVCYLAYLFSQLAYFFSAFSGFLPENYEFTVSEYARRGFFEMSVIAVINFCMIFVTLLISRKNEGKSCLAIRIICTFIGIFTLIIIATALSKMFLYINSLGMTRLRIQTSAFMIFLAVVFISLIIRLYLPGVRVIRVAFISAAAVLVVLGTVNMNAVVARYNYEAYKSKELQEIDVNAICDLGDEGIPYLVKLADDENIEVSDKARDYLSEVLYNGDYEIGVVKTEKGYGFKENSNHRQALGEWTLPHSVAKQALEDFIKDNKIDIIQRIESNYYLS